MFVLCSVVRNARPLKTICVMLLLNLFLSRLFSQNSVSGNVNMVIDKRVIENEDIKTFTASKGARLAFSDLDDVFFEIVSPDDISYTYRSRLAKGFGTVFEREFKKISLVVGHPFDACSQLTNAGAVKGNVVLVERGQCSFLTKTINAENAGARAAIITDNDPESEFLIEMIHDNTDRSTGIPAVFLNHKDGQMIKKSIESHRLRLALVNIPLNVTFVSKSKLRRAPWSFW